MKTKTRTEKIEDFLRGLNVENLDVLEYVNAEEVNNYDDVYNAINMYVDANGFDVEIIYYASAMKYLTENDTSLRESLEIASDMGFEVKNLSSEVLASLLASRKCREDFQELEREIDNFFDNLEDDDEDEEDDDYPCDIINEF